MSTSRLSFLFLLLLGLSLWSCNQDPKPTETIVDIKPKEKLQIPKFQKDSAYAYVKGQLAFGPRKPNTEAHTACKNWLVSQFKKFGATVEEQNFEAKAYTGEMLKGTNIIAKYNPAQTDRIVLAAHWDTRHMADEETEASERKKPIMGADDGGSGVAVLMEIARLIQANGIGDQGIDIVLFDLEDYGDDESGNTNSWCLGSQYWSRNLNYPERKPKFGILLDMVGAKNARFAREAVSMQFAGNYTNKVWRLATAMGYGNYFTSETGKGITDDHYFVNTIAQIPMLDIINVQSTGRFGAHWHTHDDQIDIIDKQTLRAVGQVVIAVIYKSASGTF